MDASWLLNRLKNPSLLEKGDERHLRELIASYPYFSAPYLLLAKSLKDQNHPAFDDLLPLISLQAFDRKRLFKLVHETDSKVEVKDEAEVEVRDEVPEPPTRHPEPSASADKASADEDEGPAVDESVSRFSVNFAEIEKETEAEIHEQSEIPEIPFLSKSEYVELSASAEEAAPDEGNELLKPVTQNPEPVTRHPELVEGPEPLTRHPEPVEGPQPLREPLEEPLPTKIDFLHWLDKLAPMSEETGGFEHKGELEVSASAEKTSADEGEEKIKAPKPVTPNNEPLPKEQLAIIDKFIETNPSVSRVKEKMYDPVVQAKESERLDDTLITETMARIFAKQEKFERAIDAYRKLQLKYPQKSDYFAALIEEIKRKTS